VTWTLPKLFVVVAIRQAESSPDRGKGFAVLLRRGESQVARALAQHGLVKLGRAKAPQSGETAALTDRGREIVDALIRDMNRQEAIADAMRGDA
jgi:hypothetical protein